MLKRGLSRLAALLLCVSMSFSGTVYAEASIEIPQTIESQEESVAESVEETKDVETESVEETENLETEELETENSETEPSAPIDTMAIGDVAINEDVEVIKNISVQESENTEELSLVSILEGYISKVNGKELTEKVSVGYYAQGTQLEIKADAPQDAYPEWDDTVEKRFVGWRTSSFYNIGNQQTITVTVSESGVMYFEAVYEYYKDNVKGLYLDLNDSYTCSVDGKEIVIENHSSNWFPVGTSITFEAKKDTFEQWYTFTRENNVGKYNSYFGDINTSKTVFTVPDTCERYMRISYQEISEDYIAMRLDKNKVKLIEMTGDIEEKEGVYYCKKGAEITLQAIAPADGKEYKFDQWYGLNLDNDSMLYGRFRYSFPKPYNETLTFTVTNELLNLENVKYDFFLPYPEYIEYKDNEPLCNVSIWAGKILSVNGVETEEYNGTRNGYPCAEGVFKAGTVLKIAPPSDSKPVFWLQEAVYKFSEVANNKIMGFGRGQFENAALKETTYIVPEQNAIELSTGYGGQLAAFDTGEIWMNKGKVIRVNGKPLDEAAEKIKCLSGVPLTIQAAKPPKTDEKGFKYVFDYWTSASGCIEFKDKNKETTEMMPYFFMHTMDRLGWRESIFAVYKKVPVEESFFTDVSKDAWYYSAVKYAYENGLLTGTSDTTFSPNDPMTRGMLVSVLYRFAGRPEVSGKNEFPDVKPSKYYAPAIQWASENGIVSGYNDGNFGPEDPITREQMTKIFYQFVKLNGGDVSHSADISTYKDADQIASYAARYVKWAVADGILKGSNGKLNPKGNATRAEVAAIMKRVIETYDLK